MRTFISIILLFCFVAVKPSSLSGIIYDKNDNSPIPGAIIQIKELSKIYTSSNTGAFNFPHLEPGNYTIVFSSIGYEGSTTNISISAKSDTSLSIGLLPSVEDLETVVITGTRTEKRLKDVPVLTQLVHPSHLQEIGLTTVNAALEHEVPGLNLSQFSYRSKVSFQGMNAKYVLFLIDGERIAGEMDGDLDYSRLNLDNVERIEVVRGASSALYGSNAIGGVINIITKKQTAAFDYNAYGRYSSQNNINAGTSFGFKRKRLSGRTNFSYNFIEAYKLKGDSIRTKTQDTAMNMSIAQKFEYKASDKLLFTANGSIFYNKVYDGDIIPKHHAYSGIGGYIKAQYLINAKSDIELSFVSDNYSAYEVYFKNNDKHSKYSSDIQQCARLLGRFSTIAGQIIAGIEYKPEKIYSIRVSDTSRSASEQIIFVQDDYTINKYFSIVAGARATQHSQYGINFVPKISGMARFNNFALRASYGKGFRSPSLKEMYYSFEHLGMFILKGNPNLRPEKSDYYGFSIELNHSINNFSINFYYNDVRDMIANIWIEPKVGEYTNYQTATIKGIDILEKIIPFKNLLISTGLSLVDSKNNETGLQLYGSSPLSVNFSTRYSFLIFEQSASFEIFGKYTGKRTYEPVGDYSYIDQPMQLWKCTYTQQYKNMFYLSLGVDNVFNRIDPNSLGNISPGRNYFVSLSYKFVKY